MTTAQFKEKYEALQKEAKAIATELKPLAKRYRTLSKKAITLGSKADNDKHLYKMVQKLNSICGDDLDTDGWNIHVLFRLSDFDGYEEDAHGVLNLLLNLVDEPFAKKKID